jgi:GR25 family glycosyltransferase involved in LPS biosynthesis
MNNSSKLPIAIVMCDYINENINLANYEKYINLFDIFCITNNNIVSDKIKIINNEYHKDFISNSIENYNDTIIKYYKTQSYKIEELKKYEYICWIEYNIINFDSILDNIKQILTKSDIYLFKSKNQNLLDLYVDNCYNALYKNKNLRNQIQIYKKTPNIILYDSDIIIYKNCPKVHTFMDKWWNEIKEHGLMCNLSLSYLIIKSKTKLKLNILGDKYNYIKNELIKVKDINKYVNYIDGILWINLDRSPNRKTHMENILSDISIPKYRISAIDGTTFNMENNVKNMKLRRNFSLVEKACTLSHIKAINYAKNLSGNYFIICEDDIKIVNIYLLNINLEKVILEAPIFDILIISKIFYKKLSEQYTKWIPQIQGTQCYVISRTGLEKICSMVHYDNLTDTFIFNTEYPFEVADLFIYAYVNTYAYKYNLISTLDEESTIHLNHLNNHKRSSKIQFNNILTDLFN